MSILILSFVQREVTEFYHVVHKGPWFGLIRFSLHFYGENMRWKVVSPANKKCISNREQFTMHNTQMISPGHIRCQGPRRRSVPGVVVIHNNYDWGRSGPGVRSYVVVENHLQWSHESWLISAKRLQHYAIFDCLTRLFTKRKRETPRTLAKIASWMSEIMLWAWGLKTMDIKSVTKCVAFQHI